jgi:ABC-type multidrug transport system ATPase subunit
MSDNSNGIIQYNPEGRFPLLVDGNPFSYHHRSSKNLMLLMGPNGIGKSTIAGMFASVIPFHGARNGVDFFTGKEVVFQPQDVQFLPGTVENDFETFLGGAKNGESVVWRAGEFCGKAKDTKYESIEKYARGKYKKLVSDLSGGEQQMLSWIKTFLFALKKATINHMDKRDVLVVLDEPSKQLSYKNIERIRSDFLPAFASLEVTFLFISHELNFIHDVFHVFFENDYDIHFYDLEEADGDNQDTYGKNARIMTYTGSIRQMIAHSHKWADIMKNEYIRGFFGNPVQYTNVGGAQNGGESRDMGRVKLSYPYFSGLYKIILEESNQYEYISKSEKNRGDTLYEKDVLFHFYFDNDRNRFMKEGVPP